MMITHQSLPPNTKVTYEINPERFLDTKICYNNSSVTTKVHRRVTAYWSSSIPKRYKRNAIYGDLCRAESISSDFNNEKMLIRQKFDNAGYPSPFINSAIRYYEHKTTRR